MKIAGPFNRRFYFFVVFLAGALVFFAGDFVDFLVAFFMDRFSFSK